MKEERRDNATPVRLPSSYEALIAEARREFEQQADLTPSEWVLMRERIDAEMVAPPVRGSWAVAGAVAALAAVATLALVTPINPSGEAAPEVRIATNTEMSAPVVQDDAPVEMAAEVSFQEGERVVAAEEPVTITVGTSHRFVLAPSSVAILSTWNADVRSLRLERGSVNAHVMPARPEETIEVVTASATVRVIGTDFSVTLGANAETRVDVSHGVVEVRDGRDTSVSLVAGQTHTVKPSVSDMEPRSPSTRARAKRIKRHKTPKNGLRIIEIEVPDQVDPAVHLNAQP